MQTAAEAVRKTSQLANLANQLNLLLARDKDGQMSDFFIHTYFGLINFAVSAVEHVTKTSRLAWKPGKSSALAGSLSI